MLQAARIPIHPRLKETCGGYVLSHEIWKAKPEGPKAEG
jgi:hypothetical protein